MRRAIGAISRYSLHKISLSRAENFPYKRKRGLARLVRLSKKAAVFESDSVFWIGFHLKYLALGQYSIVCWLLFENGILGSQPNILLQLMTNLEILQLNKTFVELDYH